MDLAGAQAPPNLDGKSFKAALGSSPPSVNDWRAYSDSEFYVDGNTWMTVRHINESSHNADFKMTWWCSNQSEVFDLVADPWELTNLAGSAPTAFGEQIVKAWLPLAYAMSQCSGASCHAPQPPAHLPVDVMPCHASGDLVPVMESYLDI